MLPWSVIASAGIPIAAVRRKRSGNRAAPSSMEYSVCTCRCTNESLDPDDINADALPNSHSPQLNKTTGEAAADILGKVSQWGRSASLRHSGCRFGPVSYTHLRAHE